MEIRILSIAGKPSICTETNAEWQTAEYGTHETFFSILIVHHQTDTHRIYSPHIYMAETPTNICSGYLLALEIYLCLLFWQLLQRCVILSM